MDTKKALGIDFPKPRLAMCDYDVSFVSPPGGASGGSGGPSHVRSICSPGRGVPTLLYEYIPDSGL